MPTTTTPLPYRYPDAGPWWVDVNHGSDTVGDGSQANPWASIQKARDYIRTNRLNEGALTDLLVNVRAGTYRITSPIVFGQADSGFNGRKVKYVSYDGIGAAVIDAGVQITNWTNVSGSIFKAPVPNLFWTMYENDIRSDMCRLPHKTGTVGFPMSRAPYLFTQSDAVDTHNQLIYDPADINPTGWSASDLQVVQWPGGFWEWLTEQNPVSAIDTVGHILSFPNLTKFPVYNAVGSRYFVQGVQAMQASPGEWYLDRAGGFLYYIARDGDIHSQNIVIPSCTEAVQFFGNSDKDGDRCSNVTFSGFSVQHTDHVQWFRPGWPVNSDGSQIWPSPTPWLNPGFSWLATMPQNMLGAIHLRHTDNITVDSCHVKNAGMFGAFLDSYGQQNQIINSWIEQCGCSGIRAEGYFPGLADVLNHNTYKNLRINNCGELSGEGGGIDIAQTGNNLIQYIDAHDFPRKAIWVFAVTNVASLAYTHDNLIDHFLCRNACQESEDTGAIGFDSLSSNFPNMNQNTLSQCIVDGVVNGLPTRDVPPNGVFCDDQTDGTIMTNVQVSNTQGDPFRMHDSAHHVFNNTSYLSDGTANPAFDVSQMDTANIGTTSSFPY